MKFLISIITVFLIFSFFLFSFRKHVRLILKPKLKRDLILKIPENSDENAVNVLFLHHSTGRIIWEGGMEKWFKDFRSTTGKPYYITEQHFPFEYNNNPFDYWNIWVKHAGNKPWFYEPTLEMITSKYNVVVFKHCFPVSDIEPDSNTGKVSSDKRTLANYKLQYLALRDKLLQFPNTKFILWTGAALVKNATTPEHAQRAREFFDWVKNEWDREDDNIFLWDFYNLETEGNLYLLEANSKGVKDSHPNQEFAIKVAPYFSRIVDVVKIEVIEKVIYKRS